MPGRMEMDRMLIQRIAASCDQKPLQWRAEFFLVASMLPAFTSTSPSPSEKPAMRAEWERVSTCWAHRACHLFWTLHLGVSMSLNHPGWRKAEIPPTKALASYSVKLAHATVSILSSVINVCRVSGSRRCGRSPEELYVSREGAGIQRNLRATNKSLGSLFLCFCSNFWHKPFYFIGNMRLNKSKPLQLLISNAILPERFVEMPSPFQRTRAVCFLDIYGGRINFQRL